MKTKIVTLVSLLITFGTQAQTFTEKITKELTFEKKGTNNALMVANIDGNIHVVGYEGDKILLEVEKTITAKTNERLEHGKSKINLGVIDRADTLILYVEGLCSQFGKNKNNHQHEWGYQWNDCNKQSNTCREDFDYRMNFTLKVPFAVHLMLSTVNDGDITVASMKSNVHATNVNGSIKLTKLTQASEATTVNGDVDIEYDHNPIKDCKFYTLNGDINAFFQKGLMASLSFQSFNGHFYTNIDKLEALPAMVEKNAKGDGIRYKVKGNRYQVGSGGANLDFETFNGDVYLKEVTN